MSTSVFNNFTMSSTLSNSTENVTSSFTSECHWNLPTFEWIRVIVVLLGGVVNALTVIVVIVNKSLHNVTYATIAHIAFADSLYCFSAVVWYIVIIGFINFDDNFRSYVQCVDDILFYFVHIILNNAMGSAYLISGFSVAYLSMFRYIIIVHPFKAQQLLRKQVIIVIFVMSWILGISFEAWKTYKIDSNGALRIVSECGFSFALPSLIMITFHSLKIINLRQNQFRKDDKQIRKMERIVIAAVTAFLVLPLPYQVFRFLHFTSIYKAGYLAMTITGCLMQLNSCINPILYALLSPQVRGKIINILCVCRHCVFDTRTDNSSRSTCGTSLASISTHPHGIRETSSGWDLVLYRNSQNLITEN